MRSVHAAADAAPEPGSNVPRIIRSLLEAKELPASALARLLDITDGTMSKKLHGRIPISVMELARIAEFLGVEPGVLFRSPEDIFQLDTAPKPSSHQGKWTPSWSDITAGLAQPA